jgi:hypothetical protein
MKFLMFIKHAETNPRQQPPKGLMDAMEKFVGDSFAKGILKDTGGLVPAHASTYIQSKGGKVTVKDGPFAESKEVVGGYAMVETKTREEALELARQFMELHRVHWPEFECVSEVRQVEEF